jgi:hypothetical protein
VQRAVSAMGPVTPDTPPEPLEPVRAEPEAAPEPDEANTNITALDLKSRRDRTHEDR